MTIKIITIFALLLLTTVSADLGWGSCPKPKVLSYFDVKRAAGNWFETKIDNTNLMEILFWRCTQEDYTLKLAPNDDTYQIFTPYKGWFGEYNTFGQDAQLQFQFANGTGTVNFLGTPGTSGLELFDFPFLVLDTDYNNFIIIYSCFNFGAIYLDAIWVMNRTPQPSQHVWNLVDSSLKWQKQKYGLPYNLKDLYTTTQEDCVYDAVEHPYRK